MAPAELPMPKQIDVVFNQNTRSRYRAPLTVEWRNGDDMEAWLVEAIDGDTKWVLSVSEEIDLPKLTSLNLCTTTREQHCKRCKYYRQALVELLLNQINGREQRR